MTMAGAGGERSLAVWTEKTEPPERAIPGRGGPWGASELLFRLPAPPNPIPWAGAKGQARSSALRRPGAADTGWGGTSSKAKDTSGPGHRVSFVPDNAAGHCHSSLPGRRGTLWAGRWKSDCSWLCAVLSRACGGLLLHSGSGFN